MRRAPPSIALWLIVAAFEAASCGKHGESEIGTSAQAAAKTSGSVAPHPPTTEATTAKSAEPSPRGATSAPSEAPVVFTTGHPVPEHEVFSGAHIRLVTTDSGMTKEAAEAVGKRADAVYAFVEQDLAWKDHAKLSPLLTVHALHPDEWKIKFPGDDGITTDKDNFFIESTYLMQPVSDLTFAHEVTHAQDERQMAPFGALPTYWMEGRARAGNYAQKIGYDLTSARKNIAAMLKKVTGAQVRYALATNLERKAHKQAGETTGDKVDSDTLGNIGRMYVEFLRVRGVTKPVPDVIAKTSEVVQAIGKGDHFPDAFKKVFGVSLDESHEAFFKYVDSTADKPAERFKGTVWEPFANP